MFRFVTIVVALTLCFLSFGACLSMIPDHCFRNDCQPGQICVPEPKQCVREPCPQYRCEGDATGDDDPCADFPCKPGQQCIPDRKACFTTPCPQYRCERFMPCSWIRCRAGYKCINVQCKGLNCTPTGHCVKDVPEVTGKSCPSTDGTFSTCDFTDCTKTGCEDGKMCCRKACGGTSCQVPI